MYFVWTSPWNLFRWVCSRECSFTKKSTDLLMSSFTISISSSALFFICSIRTALLSKGMSLSTAPPPCVLSSIPSQSARSFHWRDWGSVYRVPSNESLLWELNLAIDCFNDSVVDVICFPSLIAILWPSEVQAMNTTEKNGCNIRVIVDTYETSKDYQVGIVCILVNFTSVSGLRVQKELSFPCKLKNLLKELVPLSIACMDVHERAELIHTWGLLVSALWSHWRDYHYWSRRSVLEKIPQCVQLLTYLYKTKNDCADMVTGYWKVYVLHTHCSHATLLTYSDYTPSERWEISDKLLVVLSMISLAFFSLLGREAPACGNFWLNYTCTTRVGPKTHLTFGWT